MFKLFRFSLFLLLISFPCFADVVSLDSNYVAGQADLVTKLNNDRTSLTNGVNNIRGVYAGSVQSSGQIKADTVGEENMADDANPRIRTAEGASCTDYVSTGLLPSTSASLIGSIPAGVAYPDGFRVEKTSSTAKTFTASKWTFGYINTSGSFEYQEVSIGAATPADPANSADLFRVSTDATLIYSVTDLRKTSCTNGPFEGITDTAGEANLDDIFIYGANKVSANAGYIQGVRASYNTTAVLAVTPGSVYINGKYRVNTTDTLVPQTADDPSTGTSGLDSGSIAASTKYYVYAVADQDSVKTFSVSLSTSPSSPAGLTNYRRIGTVKTDGSSNFVNDDLLTFHTTNQQELVAAWAFFDGSGTPAYGSSFNFTGSITDNGTGDYTLTIADDMANTNYACLIDATISPATREADGQCNAKTAGSVRVQIHEDGATAVDVTGISVVLIGERP